MSQNAESDWSGLDDPNIRVRFSAAGCRAFVNTMTFLKISKPDALGLLGNISEAAYDGYIAQGAPPLNADMLLRMSHIFGIVASLRSIFADDESGRAWLHSANCDVPFAGLSPLTHMVDGSLAHLRDVRKYLSQWQQ